MPEGPEVRVAADKLVAQLVDEIVERLKKKGAKRRAYRHAVFARAGLPCYRCSEPIEKTSIASRRLYFCPVCQGI